MKFQIKAPYKPTGDQPKAIKQLVEGIMRGEKEQTLLGVTGSGKTFTMANVIATLNRPTLIMSHNKTLAAQLYSEFKQFFPDNAVEYFISYYDYYQPEAYMPTTNVYIEKDMLVNQEIEKMRLKTAASLLSGRRDVIVVSSVACIYGMSNPEDFGRYALQVDLGQSVTQKEFLLNLVGLLYHRSEEGLKPGTFRVRGDVVDVFLAYTDDAYRFFFFGDEVEAIHRIHTSTGKREGAEERVVIFPANLFVTSKEVASRVVSEVEVDLAKQVAFFNKQQRSKEAQRIQERTGLDMEMIQELGYCSGIENYSRYFDRRPPGQRPYCLLDYFPKDYLLFVDESHVTLPQVRAMWGGDHARKKHLVDYAFRLPSAIDNRPLHFQEFEQLTNQTIFVSATPADYELTKSKGIVVEQMIRPTGLLDPTILVHPTENQIDHLIAAIQERIQWRERILITTLTKRMAEELTKYLTRAGIKCQYIHSEVKTLERVNILEQLRTGTFHVLVGVNLLREGLDLPEVSLVAILDADKEGFLRNARSLIQTIGRAARHVNGKVIMYADKVTESMKAAIYETRRRREKQLGHNKAHDITPKAVQKAISSLVATAKRSKPASYTITPSCQDVASQQQPTYNSLPALKKSIAKTQQQMKKAAADTDYLTAKKLLEELNRLKDRLEQKR